MKAHRYSGGAALSPSFPLTQQTALRLFLSLFTLLVCWLTTEPLSSGLLYPICTNCWLAPALWLVSHLWHTHGRTHLTHWRLECFPTNSPHVHSSANAALCRDVTVIQLTPAPDFHLWIQSVADAPVCSTNSSSLSYWGDGLTTFWKQPNCALKEILLVSVKQEIYNDLQRRLVTLSRCVLGSCKASSGHGSGGTRAQLGFLVMWPTSSTTSADRRSHFLLTS